MPSYHPHVSVALCRNNDALLTIGAEMNWLVQNKDTVGIVLASCAIVVSLTTVLIARRQQQLSAFLQVQQLMLTPENQHGRRLLYRVGNLDDLPQMDTDDFYLINRSMAIFDLVGALSRRGAVKRNWILDYWHRGLRDMRPGYEALVRRREENNRGANPRPDFDDLYESGQKYRCRRRCCQPRLLSQTAANAHEVEPVGTRAADGAGNSERPPSEA
jgi:hypothetical protein